MHQSIPNCDEKNWIQPRLRRQETASCIFSNAALVKTRPKECNLRGQDEFIVGLLLYVHAPQLREKTDGGARCGVFASFPILHICFLPPSVRLEVEGLSELLLRHFSDILIFWKIFKVNLGLGEYLEPMTCQVEAE